MNGEWGIGKTKLVNTFLKRYIEDYNNDVYRISCFGISSRSQIDEIIKLQYYQNTENYIFSLIKSIPLLEEIFDKLFTSEFSFSKINKNAIFIFDDFERISVLDKENLKKDSFYKASRNLDISAETTVLENLDLTIDTDIYYSDINSEFLDIEYAFQTQEKEEIYKLEYIELEKYNTITGYINELTDIYSFKVIVISNMTEIKTDAIRNMIIDKLHPEIYTVCYQKTNDLKPVLNEYYSSIRSNNRKEFEIISKIFSDKIDIFLNELLKSGNVNIRKYQKSIRNITFTLEEIDLYLNKNDYTNEQFNNITNSVIFSLFLKEYNVLSNSNIHNIYNLDMSFRDILEFINKDESLYNFFKQNKVLELKWCGNYFLDFRNNNLNSQSIKVLIEGKTHTNSIVTEILNIKKKGYVNNEEFFKNYSYPEGINNLYYILRLLIFFNISINENKYRNVYDIILDEYEADKYINRIDKMGFKSIADYLKKRR